MIPQRTFFRLDIVSPSLNRPNLLKDGYFGDIEGDNGNIPPPIYNVLGTGSGDEIVTSSGDTLRVL